jgi:hypothetical protein
MAGSFVAGDHPLCVRCGSPTCPSERDGDQGAPFPRRQFECVKCNVLIARRAGLSGSADPMHETAVQGWLNSALVPPS